MKFQVTWIQYYTEFHILTGTESTKTCSGRLDAPFCALNTVNKCMNIAAGYWQLQLFWSLNPRMLPGVFVLDAEWPCDNLTSHTGFKWVLWKTGLRVVRPEISAIPLCCKAPVNKTSQTTDDQMQHTAAVVESHVHVWLWEHNQSVSFLSKAQRDIEVSRTSFVHFK